MQSTSRRKPGGLSAKTLHFDDNSFLTSNVEICYCKINKQILALLCGLKCFR